MWNSVNVMPTPPVTAHLARNVGMERGEGERRAHCVDSRF
jgi:hypothetical protein